MHCAIMRIWMFCWDARLERPFDKFAVNQYIGRWTLEPSAPTGP